MTPADSKSQQPAAQAAVTPTWDEHKLAELYEFAALSPTQKFRLLMHALEFMRALDKARASALPDPPSKTR